MSNRERGLIKLQAGEVAYSLQFTINGMCALEDAIDGSAPEFLTAMGDSGQVGAKAMSNVRLLLWAGLQEHHPDLTLRDVGSIITEMGGVEVVMEFLEKAVQSAQPDEKPRGKGNTKPGKNPATA